MEGYDVAIVGGGAAGSILAARLSEDRARRVILIEAGSDTPPGHVPADITDEFPAAYSNPDYFWPGLKAVSQPGQAENPFPQARVMGGGSSVMGMWALRGLPRDYDAWRDIGATGWSWDDVLPFFNKLEHDLDFRNALHGHDGPIAVRRHRSAAWPRFVHGLVAAANGLGLPLREDINGDFRDGVFPVPLSNNGTGRISSATGYLTAEVRRRPNLTILTDVEVKRMVFAGSRVTGLEISGKQAGGTLICRQVVVAAGTIGSPALLLRSGVGPASELQALGISPIADVPGVGKRLQNHCIVNLVTRIASRARQSNSLRTYGLACARLSSNHADGQPGDLHLQFITKTSLNPHGDRLGLVGAALYSPLSRGQVSLVSPDPSVPPRIEFRLLEHPADRERIAIALGTALTLLANPSVRSMRDDVFSVVPSSIVRRLNQPGFINYSLSNLLALAMDAPAPIRKLVVAYAGKRVSEADFVHGPGDDMLSDVTAIFHPTGTCAMGSEGDPLAVLDSSCRVRGTVGLRVTDASIMPFIPAGNTCLPTMMVAERASKLITTEG
jgi:5-(hydroxymethyl)furfural/furfural oxidase